ncbi:MAG: glycosyltransferase family 2 protein [Promethearchaeota archaeon]|nr:MAG: glycosyltransferase family 2 protein [Candidatus Lokiarchaeota archaeon]
MIILTIIIPAFNEEKTIEQVINTIPKFSKIKTKVLVIDDGSVDNTLSYAQRQGAELISNIRNLGLGSVFKIGLSYALKENSNIIAILDADGQYESYRLKELIYPIIEENYDFVIGNRFFNQEYFESDFLKGLANRVISIFISKLILRLDSIYDIQSSFRAFNCKLAKFVEKNIRARYNYAQEMFILASLNKFKIKQIPVKCKSRSSGKSKLIKNPFLHIFRILWISFKTYIKYINQK